MRLPPLKPAQGTRTAPPVLSIIVPVSNAARTIEKTLAALQPFRQRGAEVIVVDGESDDDTVSRATPLADRVIRAARGRPTQMNEGAKVASGFIFLFLPNDIALPTDADTQVTTGRARDTSVWGRFDMRLTGQHMLLPLVARWLNWRSRMSGIAAAEQAIFVQRETFFRIGGFPEMPVMDDVAMSKTLGAVSPPICVTSRVTVPGKAFDRDGLWTTLKRMALMRFRYRMGMEPSEILKRYGDPKSAKIAPAKPQRREPNFDEDGRRKIKPSSSGSAPARKRS